MSGKTGYGVSWAVSGDDRIEIERTWREVVLSASTEFFCFSVEFQLSSL